MASAALERAIGKAFLDEDFAANWRQDFENETPHLGIDDSEQEDASEELNKVIHYWGELKKNITADGQQTNSDAESARHTEVQNFAFNTFKESVTSAKKTFGRVSYMSYIIFAVGISLFTFSAITGLMKDKEVFSIAFGTFGVASFVSFFIFSPSKNVQSALANLVQIEVVFMSFWNQIHFWAIPGASDDPTKKAEASSRLQDITRDLVIMLEENIESNDKKSSVK